MSYFKRSAWRLCGRHYLQSKNQGTLIAPADVAETRTYFNEVDLKFALIDRQTRGFAPEKLLTGVANYCTYLANKLAASLFHLATDLKNLTSPNLKLSEFRRELFSFTKEKT